MASSLFVKVGESGLNVTGHLSDGIQHKVVVEYFNLVMKQETIESKIIHIYSNPAILDPDQAAADMILEQKDLQIVINQLSPVVEEILQRQVKQIISEEGIDLGGQPIPPVLYHTTPLPKAFIISPRDVIRQDANISLLADLSLDQVDRLENTVTNKLGVSTLVVDIGGVGVYPTMVMRSSDLNWVVQTIAHEWTHNYLSLHPLGLLYDSNKDLRTMNETTASIVGTEISQKVIARYYPEYLPSSQSSDTSSASLVGAASQAEIFDFNTEMHKTRVAVDSMLSAGKISEAESYMEIRRQVFVAHGYMIRKLNQAYFAFYGAYADTPDGPAGQDPVGPAVRQLRSQSSSLADFLRQISWFSSFNDLEKALKP